MGGTTAYCHTPWQLHQFSSKLWPCLCFTFQITLQCSHTWLGMVFERSWREKPQSILNCVLPPSGINNITILSCYFYVPIKALFYKIFKLFFLFYCSWKSCTQVWYKKDEPSMLSLKKMLFFFQCKHSLHRYQLSGNCETIRFLWTLIICISITSQ